MSYREQGNRSDEYEGADELPPAARFTVRYRSWATLAGAAATFAMGAILGAVMLDAADAGLAMVALAGPVVLIGAALQMMGLGAAEVDLRVEPTRHESAVRVTLRRRWGFLPWTKPLVFGAARVPSLVTRWESGRFSSKYGRGKEFKRARLALRVGEVEIPLPAMRGTSDRGRELATIPLAASARAAVAAYEQAAEELRDGIARVMLDRRTARRRLDVETGPRERPLRDTDPGARVPVAITEGAYGAGPALVLLGGVALAVVAGLVAWALPHGSTAARACGAIVLPLSGATIAIVATACSYGSTLHLRRVCAEHTSLTTARDLFLFGPLFATAAQDLEPRFPYYVRALAGGEDDITRHALIEAKMGRTLLVDGDESVVRQLGERLGGRCVKEETKRAA